MGRAQKITVPAGGVSVPISVSGDTIFTVGADVQIAYDEADFGNNAFFTISPTVSYGVLCFPNLTILHVRQDPLVPVEADIFILTQIKQVVV